MRETDIWRWLVSGLGGIIGMMERTTEGIEIPSLWLDQIEILIEKLQTLVREGRKNV